MSRLRTAYTGSSVMCRKLRRLRVTVIFYTCGSLCAILLLVNFNEDVKKLLQQSQYNGAPHEQVIGSSAFVGNPREVAPSGKSHMNPTRRDTHRFMGSGSSDVTYQLQQHHHQILIPPPQQQQQQQLLEEDEKKQLQRQLLLQQQLPEETPRLWFMTRGTKFPDSSSNSLSTTSSVYQGKLWPEEDPASDRILQQLMYIIEDNIFNQYQNSSSSSSSSSSAAAASSSSSSSAAGTAGASASSSNVKEDKYSSPLVVGTRWNANQILLTDNESSFVPRAVAVDGANTNNHSPSNPSSNSNTNNNNHNNNNNNFNNASKQQIWDRNKMKTILLYYGLGMSWGSHITSGRNVFLQQKCPVNACRLTGNRAHMNKADVVVFKDVFMNPKVKRQSHQLWVMYMLECPLNTQNFLDKNVFNMTATYRHDSDIVTPYEKWVYFSEHVKSLPLKTNFAEGKTKKVAWFVSNCVAKNNRLEFARELSKYIDVDIYGACGSHSCSRANAKQCFDLLSKHYKFYLAFENSNCRDYISEKFFVNGLGNNVLPIVMGAHPDDYKRVAPEKSYIHVDDFVSPKELAQYLLKLDADDELYNEYFMWKGTGEFVNTHFFCRLCAMAHYADRSDHKNRYYEDFNKWWRGPNVCTRRSWRNQPDIFAIDHSDKQTTSHDV